MRVRMGTRRGSDSAEAGMGRGDVTEADAAQSPLSHAERARLLNALFDKARPAGGRKIPNKTVAAHVARRTGQPCSEEWISGLRKADPGRQMIVTAEQLDALSDFFRVRPVFWIDRVQAEIILASMNVVVQARGAGVRAVSLRSFAEAFQQNADSMTPEQLDILASLMKSFGATNGRTETGEPADGQDRQRQAG